MIDLKKYININKIIFLVCFIIFIIIINLCSNTYFTISFEELEPFESSMPIYYKGFKVGHTIKTVPNNEFNRTHIKSVITYKKLKLPENTLAVIKRRSKEFHYDVRNYIDLQIPDTVAVKQVQNGSILEGKNSETLETILSKHADEGTFDEMAEQLQTLLRNLNTTTNSLGDIFTTLNDILAEVKPNLVSASKNFELTSQNLNLTTQKFNNSVNEKTLSNTFEYTQNTTENFEQTSKNLKEITQNINEIMPVIDEAICNLNGTIYDVNQISSGILLALKDKMGLLRLMFGVPIKKNCR